jgi:hypothetical protein
MVSDAKMVRGDRLPLRLRQQVLAMYTHRWTVENADRTYGGKCPGCEQATRGGRIVTGVENPGPAERPLKEWTRDEWHAYHAPLVTDAEWLRKYKFGVTKGGELDQRQQYAEPVLGDDEY